MLLRGTARPVSLDSSTYRAVKDARDVSAIPWDLQMDNVIFVLGSVNASRASVDYAVSSVSSTTLASDLTAVNHVTVILRAPAVYSARMTDAVNVKMDLWESAVTSVKKTISTTVQDRAAKSARPATDW